MTELPRQVGGSFAPPLTNALLKRYGEIANALPRSALQDALHRLLDCVEKWWQLPDPVNAQRMVHPVGHIRTRDGMIQTAFLIPLSPEHAAALGDLIPWPHELDAYGVLFDGISPTQEKEKRGAAFHLLWFVRELELGREPITSDLLEEV